MRRSVLALLLACGCGPAQAPGAVALAAPTSTPIAPSLDAGTPTASTGASDAGASDPAPAGPASRAVFVDTFDASLLFADEIAQLRDVAREVVRAQHLVPADPLSTAEEAKLDALVAAGRLRDGGPVCAQRPSLNRVVAADASLHAVLYSLREEYRPGGASVIAVELTELGGDLTYPWWPHVQEWPPEARIAADVPAGASVPTIAAALRAAPATQGARRARDEAWRLPPGKPVAAHLQAQAMLAGASWAALPSSESFAREQRALDACVAAGAKFATGAMTLAVDASGKVTRCEAHPDPRQRSVADCACTALSTHAFQAGAADRRLRLEVTYRKDTKPFDIRKSLDGPPSAGPRPRVEVSVVPSEDGGVLGDDFEMTDALGALGPAVAACFRPLPARHEDALTATVDLDESGAITAVALSGADWTDAATRSCVDGALRSRGVSCPVGKGERHLVLAVGVAR